MSTLWTHGCSFTADWYLPNDGDLHVNNYHHYRDYMGGELPPVWPNLLSIKLGMDLQNLGMGGASNYYIFSSVCESSIHYKKGDVVIIGWTFLGRFRQLQLNAPPINQFKNDVWGFSEVIPGNFENYNGLLPLECVKSIAVHRDNDRWRHEVHQWMKLLQRLSNEVGFELYFWSSDDRVLYLVGDSHLNDTYKIFYGGHRQGAFHRLKEMGATTIQQESNFTIGDVHMGGNGHKIQSEGFYNEILRLREKLL